MNLLRLRLDNYRGIDESEVRFRFNGLTIVEGPNETGKTSLGEAIRLLFDYLDSSKHKNIDAIRPVHLDAGPEIELEAESGPYVFTYFKRFYKNSETTLKITSPKPENHTGREAHERADEILRETIDIDLWKALCIQQGEAVQQANLSNQTSLSAALDVAAGGHRADSREESLFDKVREEYKRYFTESGKEKKEIQTAKKVQEDLKTEVNSLEGQIQNLEKDIGRAAELSGELERLKEQKQNLRTDIFEYTKSLGEIKSLVNVLENTSLKLESAQTSEQAAKRDNEVRQELIKDVSKANKAHMALVESIESSTESVKKAKTDMVKAQTDSATSEAQYKEAESLLNLRRADFDYFNNKLQLEQLKERKARIESAWEKTARVEELLAKNNVDEDTLNAIKKADRSLIKTQAKLEMGAPNVLLRGLTDLDFQINDEKNTIAKDEERSLSLSDGVRVTIPGYLQMELTAGSSLSNLLKKVEDAKQKLDAACKDSGVNNADEAMEFFDVRREAQQSIERQKDVEKENLRDLTYEQLERIVTGLEKSVPSYPDGRALEPNISPNLESAKKELGSAEEGFETASNIWEKAREKMDAARTLHGGLDKKYQKLKVEYNLKGEELKQVENRLERSRKSTSDNELESEISKYTKTVHAEKENVKSAEANLHDKEPDRVKTLEETAKGSLQTIKNKLGDAQNENTEVRTRLKVLGEDGLYEKLHAAQSHFDHINQENAAMIRRTLAAKLLYNTMKEQRNNARLAYVAPLKEKIERLGTLLFNESFEVEVTEDLEVSSRTMDGINIPFESLSGGTKEQISLISRLACAMTVSKDGGAPLILDDALGYSDPERLKLMGAVLAKAGRECQIIILTCVPDRYSNVGEATVVRLG